MDTLADLHSLDYNVVGLKDYGPTSGYYTRQLNRLYEISKIQGAVKGSNNDPVGDLYELEDMMTWLRQHVVKDEGCLMHGDYKTDNIVFHPLLPKVIGVLDWELSTIGHPLADLANLLMPWYIPQTSFKLSGFKGAPRPVPVPEAEELIQRYCERMRRPYPIPGWDFCIAFAFFKVMIFI